MRLGREQSMGVVEEPAAVPTVADHDEGPDRREHEVAASDPGHPFERDALSHSR